MTAAKHTPGPWEVEMSEVASVRDPEGGRVAMVTYLKGPHGMGGRRDGGEVAANTRLISAAPELLEALSTMSEAFWGTSHNDREDAANAKARAAIAKATGGAS